METSDGKVSTETGTCKLGMAQKGQRPVVDLQSSALIHVCTSLVHLCNYELRMYM